jgi:dTDP-4-amino-4,6-dideoxygalactose transaminase
MPAATAVKPAFPFLDLKAQYATIRDQVNSAVERVFESQIFIMGPEVSAFEEEVKAQVGCEYVFGCASGSDALLLALMALGVGPGDEVITVPFTFVATVGAIARLHARTVFVDIDPVTFNLDPEKLEQAITPRTKAIIPVHLFGLCADLDSILKIANKRRIPVVEDAAQAIGSRIGERVAGSIGTFGCFSFFPSKNLGGAGDGGLITTNDAGLAAKLKLLRNHGSKTKYDYVLLGINSRLDALQAAVLRVKLRYLDQWANGRRKNAEQYKELFRDFGVQGSLALPTEPQGYFHVYNQYTIRTAKRDGLKEFLQSRGIPSEIYYPHALHLQPAFADLGYSAGDFPEAEKCSAEVLSLPVYPELKDEHLVAVMQGIRDFQAQR